MIITTGTVEHELSVPNLYTIGLVGDNENVVYEAILYVNSKLSFDLTYTTTEIKYPEQIGTETKIIEEIQYDENASPVPPTAEMVKENGLVYFEYPKTQVGTLVDKEIEVSVYDIPEPIEEEKEVTETKELTEFASFSVEFSTQDLSNFVLYDDLSEEDVINWIPQSVIEPYLDQHTEKLLTEQDKILNPLKYKKDMPVPPWIIRADQESTEQL